MTYQPPRRSRTTGTVLSMMRRSSAHRLAADVLQVVVHLGAHVLERAVVVVVDLGQAGDARLGPLAQGILGDVLPELGEDGGPLGAGPHDVHLALEHVEQLGQLVQPILAQETTDRRHPGVALLSPDGPAPLLGIDPHGAKLIDREWLPAEIVFATMILGPGRRRATIEPDPNLGVQHRATRGKPNQHGHAEP